MRKLLFGAVATAIVALQPTFALAQGTTPKSGVPGATRPTTTEFRVRILQTAPCVATTAGLPGIITPTDTCLVGTGVQPSGVGVGTVRSMRFVGNVLCLDPGPGGDFATFATGCPAGQTAIVQGLKLIKIPARIPKCPDVFPGGPAIVQTPVSTGIRTFFPLKFEPCDTEFDLEVEFACVAPAGTTRGQVTSVRLNRFRFIVSITADTLSWVVEALHNEPLGLCEVPCITDEGLFQLLLTQARAVATAAAGGAATLRALNDALDIMEATVVRNAIFINSVAQVTTDAKGVITSINPCFLFSQAGGAPGLPGNSTVPASTGFGFGIVDTLENPCACKLIADIFCLKRDLIGRDP